MHRGSLPFLPLITAGLSATATLLSVGPCAAQDAASIPPVAHAPAVTIRRIMVSPTKGVKASDIIAVAGRATLGKSGDTETVGAAASAVLTLYRKRGYPAARVIETEVSPDGTLNLTIAEGTIARILLIGNTRTRS